MMTGLPNNWTIGAYIVRLLSTTPTLTDNGFFYGSLNPERFSNLPLARVWTFRSLRRSYIQGLAITSPGWGWHFLRFFKAGHWFFHAKPRRREAENK